LLSICGIGDKFIQNYADLFIKTIKRHTGNIRAIDSFERHKTLKRLIKEKNISKFSPRKQKILEMRFGLNGNASHTLEEIGEEFGVTRERVRQIINKALRKLKIELPK